MTDIEGLIVVNVDLHVKSEYVDAFIGLTCVHCANCLQKGQEGQGEGPITR